MREAVTKLNDQRNLSETETEEIEHKWSQVLTTSDSEKEKGEEANFIFVNVNVFKRKLFTQADTKKKKKPFFGGEERNKRETKDMNKFGRRKIARYRIYWIISLYYCFHSHLFLPIAFIFPLYQTFSFVLYFSPISKHFSISIYSIFTTSFLSFLPNRS